MEWAGRSIRRPAASILGSLLKLLALHTSRKVLAVHSISGSGDEIRTGRNRNTPGISTPEYVLRHVLCHVPSCDGLNILIIAQADRNNSGRVKMTNADIAAIRGRSERLVRYQTGRVVADGRFLQRMGWTWVIVGYREHDVDHCGHGDCIKDSVRAAEARRQLRRRLAR